MLWKFRWMEATQEESIGMCILIVWRTSEFQTRILQSVFSLKGITAVCYSSIGFSFQNFFRHRHRVTEPLRTSYERNNLYIIFIAYCVVYLCDHLYISLAIQNTEQLRAFIRRSRGPARPRTTLLQYTLFYSTRILKSLLNTQWDVAAVALSK